MLLKHSETFFLKLNAIGKRAKFRDFQFSVLHFTYVSSNFRKQYEVQVGDRYKAFK